MSIKTIMVFTLLVLSSALASAGQVEIVMTQFTKKADTWHVGTTLRHGDTGWEHYADAWRLVDEKGDEIGKRTLYHPHVNEQQFTRSLSSFQIPGDKKIIFVEAHDLEHGWSSNRVKIDMTKSSGSKYKIIIR